MYRSWTYWFCILFLTKCKSSSKCLKLECITGFAIKSTTPRLFEKICCVNMNFMKKRLKRKDFSHDNNDYSILCLCVAARNNFPFVRGWQNEIWLQLYTKTHCWLAIIYINTPIDIRKSFNGIEEDHDQWFLQCI